MQVADLDYDLPEELIAQTPAADRDASRLLVVRRKSGQIEDRTFRELPEILSRSDFLVLNDSRVFPARLFGQRETGGRVELLLLRPAAPEAPEHSLQRAPESNLEEAGLARQAVWEALARPRRKLRVHSRILFSPELSGTIVTEEAGEKVRIAFEFHGEFNDLLARVGHVPLPPYIRRLAGPADRQRYQTVYARHPGSVAAPTAGLHFTQAMLEQLKSRDIDSLFVTLHVGYGTFRPVKTASIEEHRVDPEAFAISAAAAAGIRQSLSEGKRLIAVGTTTTRVLEHWLQRSPRLEPLTGETDLFIYPPFQFQMAQGLLTNFHLPRSSLFALACAFLGTELAHDCYRHAVKQRYRFYSYGDCMLIL